MQVYLIRMSDTDYYKVGISSNVSGRLIELQVSNPIDLILVRCYDQLDANEVEKSIHYAPDQYRVRGEWFKCDHDTIVKVFTDYNMMAVIDSLIDDTVPVSLDDSAGILDDRTSTRQYGTNGISRNGTRNTAGTAITLARYCQCTELLIAGESQHTIASAVGVGLATVNQIAKSLRSTDIT